MTTDGFKWQPKYIIKVQCLLYKPIYLLFQDTNFVCFIIHLKKEGPNWCLFRHFVSSRAGRKPYNQCNYLLLVVLPSIYIGEALDKPVELLRHSRAGELVPRIQELDHLSWAFPRQTNPVTSHSKAHQGPEYLGWALEWLGAILVCLQKPGFLARLQACLQLRCTSTIKQSIYRTNSAALVAPQ